MGELLDAKPKLEAHRGFFELDGDWLCTDPRARRAGSVASGSRASPRAARASGGRSTISSVCSTKANRSYVVLYSPSEHSSSAQGNEPVKLPVEKRLYILVSGGGAAQRTTITDANGNIVARGTTAGEGQTSNVYGGPMKWESGPND